MRLFIERKEATCDAWEVSSVLERCAHTCSLCNHLVSPRLLVTIMNNVIAEQDGKGDITFEAIIANSNTRYASSRA